MSTLALVTGAPGWIGTRLVRTLMGSLKSQPSAATTPQRPVRCLVHPAADTGELARIPGELELLPRDLTRPGHELAPFFRDAEGATLFHCAGVIHPRLRTRTFYRVNVEGTRNLLAAATRAGVRRVVHLSSNSPFGFNPSAEHQFDEQSPYAPYRGYGRSKMLGEQLVRGADERGEVEAVILRPPWFYGPDQPTRQTQFFRMIRDGKAPLLGDGSNRRSMVYIDNLCQGILLAEAVERAAGQTYWIADERPYPMAEVIDTVERVLERDFGMAVAHRRLRLPRLAGAVAGLADRLIQGAGLYEQRIHVLSEMGETIACSVERAKRELGYNPTIDLEEGMRRSIDWLRRRGEL